VVSRCAKLPPDQTPPIEHRRASGQHRAKTSPVPWRKMIRSALEILGWYLSPRRLPWFSIAEFVIAVWAALNFRPGQEPPTPGPDLDLIERQVKQAIEFVGTD